MQVNEGLSPPAGIGQRRFRRGTGEAGAGLRMIRTAAVALVLVVVGLVFPVSAASAAPPHQRVQADCGIVTCTVRFDRAATLRGTDDTYAGDALEALVCGPLGLAAAVPGVACVAVVKGVDIALREHAKAAYARGDCVGARIVPVPVGIPIPVPNGIILPAPIPISVKGGTYNCV